MNTKVSDLLLLFAGGLAKQSAYALYCGGVFLGTAAHDDVDLGNQSISLQEQIISLQAAVQTGLRKAMANPDFAGGLVNRNRGRENHLGHQYAAECTLTLILNNIGMLQSEVETEYQNKFKEFMTPYARQVVLQLCTSPACTPA